MSEYACVRVLISGRVTGVGYRYYVTSRAENYSVTGYVRNLDTGSVELEVEGPKQEVYDFLMEVKKGPTHAQVGSFQTDWRAYEKKYDRFFVKY